MTPPEKEDRYAFLRARLHLPMALLGVVWVVSIGLEFTLGPAHPAKQPLLYLDWAIWALFLSEYVMFLVLAKDRRRYAREHILDLVIILLPAFRILRLGRVLVILRGTAILGEALGEAWSMLRNRKFHYLLVLNAAAVGAGHLCACGKWNGEIASSLPLLAMTPEKTLERFATVEPVDRFATMET